MRPNRQLFCMLATLAWLGFVRGGTDAPEPGPLDAAVEGIARQLAAGLPTERRLRVAVQEFDVVPDFASDLSFYVAQELTARLAADSRLQVIDPVLFEAALDEAGLDPDALGARARRWLRRTLKLDAVVTGSAIELDDALKLDARLAALEDGTVMATAGALVVEDRHVRALIDGSLGSGPGAVSTRLEGEQLAALEQTGGRWELQYTDRWGDGWSGGAHGWWWAHKPGDRLVLALPVPADGRYRLSIQFTKANDYGIARLYLDGKELAGPIDFYAPNVVPSGVMDFGLHRLKGGTHELTVESVGAGPDMTHQPQEYVFAIDYIQLDRQ